MIKVDKIIPGGQAIATLEDGKKIFFWNALPGEEITDYRITKNKSHYAEAIATDIANVSPYRIIPQDSCYLSTSPWQIISYDYELKLKQELVTEMFREHQIIIDVPEVVTDYRDYHYRNKMEYSLYWDNDANKITLAFHERGSHRKIPIESSSIERPEIFTAAKTIVEKLNHAHEEARKYQSLLLRCNQKGEISGGLYENGKPHQVFNNLTDTILNHEYSYSPNGFFQINLPVYEMALTEIKKYIATNKVLDLYAGVGTIGLSVARDKNLTLVECDKSAFRELAKNCNMANEPSFEDHKLGRTALSVSEKEWFGAIIPILDKSENVLNNIRNDQTVILDPPRAGCDSKLIAKILEVLPQRVVYLSCNPATQARDVKMLLEKYHIMAVKTFNFFPHTPHIENLIVLSL